MSLELLTTNIYKRSRLGRRPNSLNNNSGKLSNNRLGDRLSINNYRINSLSNRLYAMSAVISPDGTRAITQQHPSEIYTQAHEDEVNELPQPARDTVKKNIGVMQEFSDHYHTLMDSIEGKELVNWYKKNGNGRANYVRIDEIIAVNEGEGLVAATYPEAEKTNVILNADYIDTHRRNMSALTSLSTYDIDTMALIHEMGHIFYQKSTDRTKPEPEVEFHNDFGHIQFYMFMANKYLEEKDRYTKKAQLFAFRYKGEDREIMENYILDNYPRVSEEISDKNMGDLGTKDSRLSELYLDDHIKNHFEDKSSSYRKAA